MLNAINNIPKPNLLIYLVLKSETSSLTQFCNNSIDTLNVFNAKLKKDEMFRKQKVKLDRNYNFIGKPKHYPPANNE